MTIFDMAWQQMPEQQQFPPASPAGRGAGSHGKGDKGDQEGRDYAADQRPDPSFDPGAGRGPQGRDYAADQRPDTEMDAAPKGAVSPEKGTDEDETSLTPAPPSMDQIAERKSQLAAKGGYDIADLEVSVNELGELEFTAKGKGYERAMELARPTDPFAAAFHDLTTMLSPFASKAAGYGFGIGIDEATGAAQPSGFAGDDQKPGGPDWGPPDDSRAKEKPEDDPTAQDPGDFTLPPPYVSPVDRSGGEQAVSEFLTTMRENVSRASARLARV